jgi:uncharacterized protein YbjT (DUF2867 family)
MRIVVTGATGHVGSRVVQQLLAKKTDVTVFVRHPDRAPAGVRVEAGELEDAGAVTRAFKGADEAFVLIPPNLTATDWPAWFRQVGRNVAQAITANGIRRVVLLSSFGAQRPKLGPVTLLRDIEQQVLDAAPDVLILRAGYFMENLLQFVPTLREQSVIYNPIAPTTKLPMVATRDVGDVAAAKLLDQTWTGHRILGVQGAADVSMSDVATILGRVLGRTVTYVQVPVQAAIDAMRQHGLSENVATAYGDMLEGLSTPGAAAEPRTSETTTPTTVEEFAKTVIRPAVLAPVPT